jgi:hypothetical protein
VKAPPNISDARPRQIGPQVFARHSAVSRSLDGWALRDWYAASLPVADDLRGYADLPGELRSPAACAGSAFDDFVHSADGKRTVYSRQQAVWSGVHTAFMDTPFGRVIRAIADRHPQQKGREQAWLADQLRIRVQNVNNWERRGLPVRHYDAIGKMLGMTYGQIAGTEDVQPIIPDWPFEGFITRQRWALARPEHRSAAAHAAMQALDGLESRLDLLPPAGKRQQAA